MLGHEGDNQLQHIMQILILQTISDRRLGRGKHRRKQVKAENLVFVLCLESHYECKCSKDIMHVPNNVSPAIAEYKQAPCTPTDS